MQNSRNFVDHTEGTNKSNIKTRAYQSGFALTLGVLTTGLAEIGAALSLPSVALFSATAFVAYKGYPHIIAALNQAREMIDFCSSLDLSNGNYFFEELRSFGVN